MRSVRVAPVNPICRGDLDTSSAPSRPPIRISSALPREFSALARSLSDESPRDPTDPTVSCSASSSRQRNARYRTLGFERCTRPGRSPSARRRWQIPICGASRAPSVRNDLDTCQPTISQVITTDVSPLCEHWRCRFPRGQVRSAAKKADYRIWSARSSFRFSFSRSMIRWTSAAVVPDRSLSTGLLMQPGQAGSEPCEQARLLRPGR